MLAPSLFYSQIEDTTNLKKGTGFFKTTDFCQPFVAEIENYKPKLGVQYATNKEEYDVANTKKDYKLFQYLVAGFEIPFYRKNFYENKKLKQALAISSNFGYHLFWDPFEMNISPIINNDYRLNTIVFKYIRFIEGKKIKNISVKLAPYNHESTHIGDDLTLYRLRRKYPITRVNVSYEYSELNFTINDPDGKSEGLHSLRFGWMLRLNSNGDYYTLINNDGDPNLIEPTNLRSEYYAQYNLIRSEGFLSWKKWKNVISLELRNRPVYQYPEFTTENGTIIHHPTGPPRAFSLNIYCGYKFVKAKGPSMGLYLTAYTGINPYGQFRNQVEHKSLGLTFVLE